MTQISILLTIIAGLLLLFAGRRLFWLAAGLVAFLFIFNVADKYFGGGWLGLILGVVVGIVFAGLAVAFARLIGYILGALAGATGLPVLFGMLGLNLGWPVAAVIGAVVGILIVAFAFDLGLILMTSWIGASAVTNGLSSWLKFGTLVAVILFVVLLVVGIGVQTAMQRRD